MKRHVANVIEIAPDGVVWIDGAPLPFYIRDDVKVGYEGSMIGWLTLSVFADTITVNGRRAYRSDRAAKAESEWAEREANRIVHEGMADVLEWLDTARREYEEKVAEYEALIDGLQSGSHVTKVREVAQSDAHDTKGDI